MKKLLLFVCLFVAFLLTLTFNAQAQTQKKGISKQGKGAIIGGAGGAVAGGLIGHNVKGALIGGAIGAGGGYIIGNEQRRADEKKRAAWRRAHPKHKRHYTKTTKTTTTTTIENH